MKGAHHATEQKRTEMLFGMLDLIKTLIANVNDR